MAVQIEPGKAKAAGIVSILILICAVADMIMGFVWISYGGGDGNGLWSGFVLAVTGVLGILTWVKLNKVAMIFFLILCILDIILCIVQCAIGALAFLIWQILKAIIATKCTIIGGHCDCGNEKLPMELEDCSWIQAIEILFLAIIIINGICTFFVFAGSIIGCMGTCCASPTQQTGVIIVQQPVVIQQHPAGVVVQQGAMTYPGQPQQEYPPQPQQAYPAQPGQYPMAEVPPKTDN